MSQLPRVRRNYSVSDAHLSERAGVFRALFIEDKAAFVAFDADFADPFAADWLAAIEAADSSMPSKALDNEATSLVKEAAGKLDDCANKFRDARHFFKKAFPDNKAVWTEFGNQSFRRARMTTAKMIPFMETFHDVAQKYKAELIAEGFSQAMIDDIKTRGDAMAAAQNAVDLFLKNTPVQTRERILKYNVVWKIMATVSRAGKLIYKDNWAMYQRYLLPRKKRKKKGEAETPTP
jgi:hypothetical protein